MTDEPRKWRHPTPAQQNWNSGIKPAKATFAVGTAVRCIACKQAMEAPSTAKDTRYCTPWCQSSVENWDQT